MTAEAPKIARFACLTGRGDVLAYDGRTKKAGQKIGSWRAHRIGERHCVVASIAGCRWLTLLDWQPTDGLIVLLKLDVAASVQKSARPAA